MQYLRANLYHGVFVNGKREDRLKKVEWMLDRENDYCFNMNVKGSHRLMCQMLGLRLVVQLPRVSKPLEGRGLPEEAG